MDIEMWIVGFDGREMSNYNFEGMKTKTPTFTSFLRDNIVKPLTVDSSIWPSVFNDGHFPHLSDEERKELGLGTIKLPEWTGHNMPLWENLQQLEEYLGENDDEVIKPCWIIAITGTVQAVGLKASPDDWPRVESTSPGVVDSEWSLVGYDVLTKLGESGLTGSCFEGDEANIQSVRDRWGPHLNEYHLFKSVEYGLRFRDFENERYPTDSPHFVYGIWQIKEVTD